MQRKEWSVLHSKPQCRSRSKAGYIIFLLDKLEAETHCAVYTICLCQIFYQKLLNLVYFHQLFKKEVSFVQQNVMGGV